MFKPENLFVQTEMFVDDKNRMILPINTEAETGEKLVIIRNDESNCYDIYSQLHYAEKIKKQIDYLEDKLKTTIDLGKRKKLQILLNDIYNACLAEVTCDKQRRIVITSILDEGEKISKIKVIGGYDHLMLRKK